MRIVTHTEAVGFLGRKEDRLAHVTEEVKPILDAVRERGDDAVREYASRFDGFDRKQFAVPEQELASAVLAIGDQTRSALETAMANIAAFARLQMPREFMTKLAPGHNVGQIVRPLETVAAYVPGGRYPLPSTVLMTCVPALVAGVEKVLVTTPKPNAVVFGAAAMAGASQVTLIGGAHAIAAFAFGTETIPKADRIVGPGNIYVSAAKRLLAGEVGIDFVAGPTEVLIIADEGEPRWIAADLLAQAEHDVDACPVFLTTSQTLATRVKAEVERQLQNLPTAAVAQVAVAENGLIVVCESRAEMIDLANSIASEHLCLHDPSLLQEIKCAGGVFLGSTSPEAAGDYVTGPNHVLPTGGNARLTGGLSVLDFVKVISVQELSAEALRELAPAVVTLARLEGLEAHARSIEVRL